MYVSGAPFFAAQGVVTGALTESNFPANLGSVAFGRVYMLYIPVEVNGFQMKAFVDSGAQTTILSPSCAERCGIMHLLDKRFSGTAHGVGTAKILGRVHAAQIKIGSSYLGISFTVMEGKDVDMLLGLDMLKGFRAAIDLEKGVLRIGADEVAFLGEADIPRNDITEGREPLVVGPDGAPLEGPDGTVAGPPTAASAAPTSASASAATAAPGPSGPSRAPTTTAPPSTTRGPTSGATATQFPAESIGALTAMGFTRDEAVHALSMTGGNVEAAAGVLFGG